MLVLKMDVSGGQRRPMRRTFGMPRATSAHLAADQGIERLFNG